MAGASPLYRGSNCPKYSRHQLHGITVPSLGYMFSPPAPDHADSADVRFALCTRRPFPINLPVVLLTLPAVWPWRLCVRLGYSLAIPPSASMGGGPILRVDCEAACWASDLFCVCSALTWGCHQPYSSLSGASIEDTVYYYDLLSSGFYSTLSSELPVTEATPEWITAAASLMYALGAQVLLSDIILNIRASGGYSSLTV